ncbi:protein-disulfide reductase DsbD domain-containing protein [Chitinophaga polysaccharea]|uniref:protein-disulfide reductase DsbD domain-containing protein n=1 Tax=Chitinophaga polysaccharea TaxID=1293035 RepID=UPI001157DB2D|nr:protein-disulfide reductase DsbD domain-containing protein [Chitinophaga polysaccharea]
MRKLLSALFLFALPALAGAQVMNPVKWNFTAKKLNASTFELHMTAMIDPGWHMYAQDTGEGPVPTSFSFIKNPLVMPVGKAKELGKLKKEFDSNFNSEMKYYEQQVDFVQTVTIKGKAATKVKGVVEFMACNDHECLPSKKLSFDMNVGGK